MPAPRSAQTAHSMPASAARSVTEPIGDENCCFAPYDRCAGRNGSRGLGDRSHAHRRSDADHCAERDTNHKRYEHRNASVCVGAGGKAVHRRRDEEREARIVNAPPERLRNVGSKQRGELDRGEEVEADDAPGDGARAPLRGEGHEHTRRG